MPLGLTESQKNLLPRSPLALVVCQVRFEELPTDVTGQAVLAIHQSLGGRKGQYPLVEQVNVNTINIPSGMTLTQAIAPVVKKGWRLRSSDNRWFVSLHPDHVALETTKYKTWEDDFRTRLASLLEAVETHLKPAVEQRLGVRYVNRITEPRVDSPQELREYISPELLGLVLHQRLGDMVLAAQQQLDLDAGDGVRVAMRHGFLRDEEREGAFTYLLDFDIYRQEVQAFDVEDIKSSTNSFNEIALRLFRQSLTDKMLRYLEGHDEHAGV